MSHKILSIAESRLINELETYTKLPFFLGILYLSIHRDNELYIGNARVKVATHKNGESTLFASFGAGWNPEHLVSFRFWDIKSGDPYNIHPTLTMCHFKSPPDIGKVLRTPSVLPEDYSKQYVYYRNKSMKGILEVLINNYMKELNYIPFVYALPYLYFHRDKQLRIKASYIYSDHYIKYNLQNNTLSARPVNSFRTYRQVMVPSELIDLYNANLNIYSNKTNPLGVLVTF
jgi:hypothetical protein